MARIGSRGSIHDYRGDLQRTFNRRGEFWPSVVPGKWQEEYTAQTPDLKARLVWLYRGPLTSLQVRRQEAGYWVATMLNFSHIPGTDTYQAELRSAEGPNRPPIGRCVMDLSQIGAAEAETLNKGIQLLEAASGLYDAL